MSRLLLVLSVLLMTLVMTELAEAATRVIIIPGRSAILIMEGVSSAGTDLDPRRLYDSIAMPPNQQSGGDVKMIAFPNKIFNYKNKNYE